MVVSIMYSKQSPIIWFMSPLKPRILMVILVTTYWFKERWLFLRMTMFLQLMCQNLFIKYFSYSYSYFKKFINHNPKNFSVLFGCSKERYTLAFTKIKLHSIKYIKHKTTFKSMAFNIQIQKTKHFQFACKVKNFWNHDEIFRFKIPMKCTLHKHFTYISKWH